MYVSINNIKYECLGLLEGVDRCFKCIFAFNAEYSADSKPFWKFLQCVYGIPFAAVNKLNIGASIASKNITN